MKRILNRCCYTPIECLTNGGKYEICNEPYPVYTAHIDILISDCRNLQTFIDDVLQVKRINPNCCVYVICDEYKADLILSIFPFVEFVSVKSARSINGILEVEKSNTKEDKANLTNREMELLSYVSFGLSQHEISELMGNSERSVRRIQTSILQKTGLKNARQLSVFALAKRYVVESSYKTSNC